MAAAKLQYCDRVSNDMRASFVNLIERNRRSFVIRESCDGDKTGSSQKLAIEGAANTASNEIQNEEVVASFESVTKMALEIAIGKTEAPASHEKVVVGVIIIWVAVITTICFLDVDQRTKELIVGITVNINLLFFYGAPLSTIFTVLKTRDSASIHKWTMLLNTANATFWTAFGFGTLDYFIMVPNGIGVVFGIIQMILCVVVPSKVLVDNTVDSGSSGDLELDAKVPTSTVSGETDV
eukprot:scaffold50014_cov66-Cyclotella_meneghiniana.AAC.5